MKELPSRPLDVSVRQGKQHLAVIDKVDRAEQGDHLVFLELDDPVHACDDVVERAADVKFAGEFDPARTHSGLVDAKAIAVDSRLDVYIGDGVAGVDYDSRKECGW